MHLLLRMQTLLFVPIMYAMLGFKFSNAAFFYWLVMYMFSLSNFTFFGQLLVYMTPSPMLAQVWTRRQPWSLLPMVVVAPF